MKSNKKVFTSECVTLSSKTFSKSLNFSIDNITLFAKNNHSFLLSTNNKYTNIGFTYLSKQELENFKTISNNSNTNYKKVDNLKSPTTFCCDNLFSSTDTIPRSAYLYTSKSSKNLEFKSLNLKDVVQEVVPKKNVTINDFSKHKLLKIKSDTSSIGIIKNVKYFNHIPNIVEKNTPIDVDRSIFLNHKI